MRIASMTTGFQNSNALLHHTRLLSPRDTRVVTKHFHMLSAHDRYLRFCGSASDAAIERLIQQRIGSEQHVFLGYYVGTLLIGVAQLACEQSTPLEWEIALSVDPAYRRVGVATRLMKGATDCAFASGVTELSFTTLPENKAMIGLGQAFGFRIETFGQCVTGRLALGDEASMPLPRLQPAYQVR